MGSERPHPTRYSITLGQLTGTHHLPLVDTGEHEDGWQPPPGAPVAYVAEPPKEAHSGYTPEGAIEAFGAFAASVTRTDAPRERRLGRVFTFVMLLPFVTAIVAQLYRLFA